MAEQGQEGGKASDLGALSFTILFSWRILLCNFRGGYTGEHSRVEQSEHENAQGFINTDASLIRDARNLARLRVVGYTICVFANGWLSVPFSDDIIWGTGPFFKCSIGVRLFALYQPLPNAASLLFRSRLPQHLAQSLPSTYINCTSLRPCVLHHKDQNHFAFVLLFLSVHFFFSRTQALSTTSAFFLSSSQRICNATRRRCFFFKHIGSINST